MISRRNIRVKVMQTLYTLDSASPDLKPEEPVTILTKKIQQTHSLYIYLIYFITQVARFSESDARQKASKHLPTAGDLSVNTKIAGNELLWKILEDDTFISAVKEFHLEHILDMDLLKRIYNELKLTDEYSEYIELQSREKKPEKKILEFILQT